jgi:hypothetical protein
MAIVSSAARSRMMISGWADSEIAPDVGHRSPDQQGARRGDHQHGQEPKRHHDGVLTITLPKTEESKAYRIKVKG